MICERCNTRLCYGPDTKSCSDQILTTLKARIMELEELGITQGFWGRACARLMGKNRALVKERDSYRTAYENLQLQYTSFQMKMTERFGMHFYADGEEINAVEAVTAAISYVVLLGNRLRHALTPHERYDAENAWDNYMIRKTHEQIHPHKR